MVSLGPLCPAAPLANPPRSAPVVSACVSNPLTSVVFLPVVSLPPCSAPCAKNPPSSPNLVLCVPIRGQLSPIGPKSLNLPSVTSSLPPPTVFLRSWAFARSHNTAPPFASTCRARHDSWCHTARVRTNGFSLIHHPPPPPPEFCTTVGPDDAAGQTNRCCLRSSRGRVLVPRAQALIPRSFSFGVVL